MTPGPFEGGEALTKRNHPVDPDISFDSPHHTLGHGATQAAPGNHKHNIKEIEGFEETSQLTDHQLLDNRGTDDAHPQYLLVSDYDPGTAPITDHQLLTNRGQASAHSQYSLTGHAHSQYALTTSLKGIRSGTVVSAAASYVVSFVPAFKAGTTPNVVAGNGDANSNGDAYFAVRATSNTQTTVVPKNQLAGNYRFNWIAIGVDS